MRTWEELHEAARKAHEARRDHRMIAGDSEEGLCIGPGGVHGVLGGRIFGNRMDGVAVNVQKEADDVLMSLGY